jgi:hypothetical protein
LRRLALLRTTAADRLRRAIRKPRSASPMLVHFTTEIFVGLIATV